MKGKLFILGVAVSALVICALRSSLTSQTRPPAESSISDDKRSELTDAHAFDSPRAKPSSEAARSAESNIAQIAALLEALPKGDRQRDLASEFVTRILETNPVAATEFVATLHDPLNFQMAAALASSWAKKDLQSAVDWVRGLSPGAMRTHALMSLCADWAESDPRNAAEFLLNSSAADFPIGDTTFGSSSSPAAANTPINEVREQMLPIIGARWAAADPQGAMTWLTQLPADTGRDSLIAGISSTLAETRPSEAAALVASMSAGPKQNEAALTVLLEWGRTDPQAAADWLKLFPAGDFRDKALLNLTGTLVEQEPEIASNVLLEWPEPAERTGAIRVYLNDTLGMDASRGAALINGIEDDSIFHEEILRVAQHWLMQEPTAARQWIGQTGLDEPSVERLLAAPGLRSPSPF